MLFRSLNFSSLFFVKFLARPTTLTTWSSGLEMSSPQDGADGPTSIHSEGKGYSPSRFDGVNNLPTSTTAKFEMSFRQDAYGDGFLPPQQFSGVNQPTSNHVESPFDKRSTAKLLRKLDRNLIPFIFHFVNVKLSFHSDF